MDVLIASPSSLALALQGAAGVALFCWLHRRLLERPSAAEPQADADLDEYGEPAILPLAADARVNPYASPADLPARRKAA
jgi:hypothetical protein